MFENVKYRDHCENIIKISLTSLIYFVHIEYLLHHYTTTLNFYTFLFPKSQEQEKNGVHVYYIEFKVNL